MVIHGKQKLIRELDQAKHRGQLLAHKKKRALLDLLKLVKDRQMVQEEFSTEYEKLMWRANEEVHGSSSIKENDPHRALYEAKWERHNERAYNEALCAEANKALTPNQL